ncbi:hypothetical protein HAX54_037811 [Datura stramonium]|uniref:Uncharacterized protein n=1 Tax=Datura stramonium TaxID=4076 RepID=A0ABS8VLP3_DATST|nr:hypothetical protein [Datura stramonium]
MDQVHVDEKDIDKENYFGSFHGKTRCKKFNKVIVGLPPMSKENEVMLFLYIWTIRYDDILLYNKSLTITSQLQAYEVLVAIDEEIHVYEHFNTNVNSSYIEESMSGMIEDARLYHKSVQFDGCFRDLVLSLSYLH